MAKQVGNVRIEGTIDNITFYRMNNKDYARAKRNVSREQILNDPKFVSARENGNEFGLASKSGKLLRDVVKDMYKEAVRRSVAEKVLQLMIKIQKSDIVSERGKRNIGVGIADLAAKALLKGFEFNDKLPIKCILFKPYIHDVITGQIIINNLVPNKDIKIPSGATHLTLRSAYTDVNFTTGTSAIAYSNEVSLKIDGTPSHVELLPASVPAGTGTKIYLLQIKFFQTVNDVRYELNNDSCNSLAIVEVA